MKTLGIALLLLGLVSTVTAQVTDETENFNGNLLKYPIVALENKSVAKKINKDIADKLAKLKKQHSSMKGAADKISMSYKVLLENDDRLNLLVYSWTYCNGAAHGMYTTAGLSYDLHSEKKAIPSDYIGTPSPQTLDEGVRLGIFQLTDTNNDPVSLTDFWKVETISRECVVNEDGSLTLIYQPYDLAPYAVGNTFITIPPSEFVTLGGKYPKSMIKQAKAEQNAQTKAAKQLKEQYKAEQSAQEKAAKQLQQQAKLEQSAQEKAAKQLQQQAKIEHNAQAKAAKLQQQRNKVAAKNELKALKQNQKAELERLKAKQREELLNCKNKIRK